MYNNELLKEGSTVRIRIKSFVCLQISFFLNIKDYELHLVFNEKHLNSCWEIVLKQSDFSYRHQPSVSIATNRSSLPV